MLLQENRGCSGLRRGSAFRSALRRAFAGFALIVVMLAMAPRMVHAEEQAREDAPLNERCTLDWTGFCNHPSRMIDGRPETSVSLEAGDSGAIYWTEDVDAGIIYWEWTIPPATCTFDFLDVDGTIMQQNIRIREGVRGYLEVPDGCFGIRLTAGDACELSEWRVYAADRLPEDVLLWEPAPEKCDLMLVVAHSDDELVMMGGIIPTYAAERGYRVQVVYCYVPELERHAEALAGLRCNGMTTMPVIFVTEDEHRLRFAEKITNEIRRFRPEVVITHDIDGEYGNPGHVLVSRETRKAVEAAVDPAMFPESAETFGVWQVKKLYIHLYEENQIRMDFDTPLSAFDGKTAFEMAQIGYACHQSQRSEWLKQLQSNRWDCRLYGLYSSTVGADMQKNDFLENIPPDLLSNYVPPTPAPTATPAPTPVPTAVPVNTPPAVETLSAENQQSAAGGMPTGGVMGAALLVLLFAGLLVLRAIRNGRNRKR